MFLLEKSKQFRLKEKRNENPGDFTPNHALLSPCVYVFFCNGRHTCTWEQERI